MRSFSRRRGFTLVELLVVIAIIGVLVALLLPAVQSVREAARRQSCLNNLKQMALAMHNYESTWKILPVGLLGAPEGFSPTDDGYGWGLTILPFIEQKSLYDEINPQGQPGIIRSTFNTTGKPIKGGETPVKTFRCPTSQLPKVVPPMWRLPGGNVLPPSGQFMIGYAINDYKGNGGGCHSESDGVLGKRAEIPWTRFAEISDGLSNMGLIGESSYVTGENTTSPTVIEDWPIWIGGPNTDEAIRYEGRTGAPINCQCNVANMVKAINDDCAFSWHPGGGQFAFCDGAVRFVSQNVSGKTWCDLHSKNDGNPVGDF